MPAHEEAFLHSPVTHDCLLCSRAHFLSGHGVCGPTRQGPSLFLPTTTSSSEGRAHGSRPPVFGGWITASHEIKQDLCAQLFVLVLTLASSSFP